MVQELRLLREAEAAAGTKAQPSNDAARGSHMVSGGPANGGNDGEARTAATAGGAGAGVPAMPGSDVPAVAKRKRARIVHGRAANRKCTVHTIHKGLDVGWKGI